MRNLVISVLVVGLLSLLPLSPRVGPSSGLLPVSISLGQDEAKAYVTYRRARVTTRRVYRRAYRRSYYHYWGERARRRGAEAEKDRVLRGPLPVLPSSQDGLKSTGGAGLF